MTNEDLIRYLGDLGHKVEILDLGGSGKWIVIRDFLVLAGSLKGQLRDVAVMWSTQIPYVPHSSVQVRPHVVPMGTRNAQQSPLGAEWQYLSRVLRGQPTPQAWVVHINTVLSEI
jgi:hypothetical protein